MCAKLPGTPCPCDWSAASIDSIVDRLAEVSSLCLHELCVVPKRLAFPVEHVQCPDCKEFVSVDDLRVTIPPLPKRKP